MKLVQPGDLIFSYANTVVKDVGVATGSAALLPKPSNFGKAGDAWANQGWMVPVKFISLRRAFHPKSHMSAISTSLPAKYSPINADGDGNQVAYLASMPDAMFKAVTAAMAGDWGDIHPKLQSVIAGLNTPLSDEDDEVAGAIQNRTDIGETERTQLVKARRGQGIYRKNLEGFETHCRLTGLKMAEHLRASHIKPWRASSDFEKLDGNNGLLLSPHVDHLFDRGFISFSDDGQLLVSSKLNGEVLKAWGVPKEHHTQPFRNEQLPYLAFHREFVFQG